MKYWLLLSALFHISLVMINRGKPVATAARPIDVSLYSGPPASKPRAPTRFTVKAPRATASVAAPKALPETGESRGESSEFSSTPAENGGGSAPQAADYMSRLWLAIESVKEYPALARSRGQSGKVGVQFTLSKSGEVKHVMLSSASEFESLNQAAIATIYRLGKFEPVPDSLSKGDWTALISLNFTLGH